jgi:hypothetical protein
VKWIRSGLVALLVAVVSAAGLVVNAGTATADGGGWGWSASGGLTMGATATGLVEGAAPGAARVAPICTGARVQCAIIGSVAVLGLTAVATCATFSVCQDTWWPAIKSKLPPALGGPSSSPNGSCGGAGAPSPCNSVTMGGTLSFAQTPVGAGAGAFQIAISLNGVNDGQTGQVRNSVYLECINAGAAGGSYDERYVFYGNEGPVKSFGDWCNAPSSGRGGLKRIDVYPGYRTNGNFDFWTFSNRVHWEVPSGSIVPGATQLQCQRPDGSTYQVAVETPDAREALRIGHCDPGDTAIGVRGAPTVGQLATDADWDIDLRPRPEDTTNYPQCSGAACSYQVFVDGSPCLNGKPGCTNWTRVQKTAPSRVKCHYGPYTVDVSLCWALERAYEGTPRKVTELNTDGNPDTYDDPAPAGQPQPQPSPSPNPSKPPATGQVEPTPALPTACGPVGQYNLGPVQPATARLVSILAPMFGVTTVYGWRESDPVADDHPKGVAADFMANKVTGDQIAAYAQEHATSLGIQYIIWQQQIWNVDRASEGWRAMPDRGNPTANHMDHVHITVKSDGSAVAPCAVEPGSGGENDCFVSGWTWNIVEVIVKPSKCVLRWAFVPRQEVVSGAVSDFRTVWSSRPPGSVVVAVVPVVASLSTGWSGSCLGMPDFSISGSGEGKVPCSPPGGGVGSAVYVLIQIALVVGTAFKLWAMVAAAVSARATGE